jgi:hypothetical protein
LGTKINFLVPSEEMASATLSALPYSSSVLCSGPFLYVSLVMAVACWYATPLDSAQELALLLGAPRQDALGTFLFIRLLLNVLSLDALRWVLCIVKLGALHAFYRQASRVYGPEVVGHALLLVGTSVLFPLRSVALNNGCLASPIVYYAFALLLQVKNGLALATLTFACFVYGPCTFLLIGYLSLLAVRRPSVTLAYCQLIVPVMLAGLVGQSALRYWWTGHLGLPALLVFFGENLWVPSLSVCWYDLNRWLGFPLLFVVGGVVGRYAPFKFATPVLLFVVLSSRNVDGDHLLLALPNLSLLAGCVLSSWYIPWSMFNLAL